MKKKKVALVLSGGGGKGAFQFGAIKFIYEKVKTDPQYKGFEFDIISGVSVGSLNGVMLAMDKFNLLEKFWNEVSNRSVFTGSPNFGLNVFAKILFGKSSILGNNPLKRKLENHVRLSEIAHDFRFGTVSLSTGDYIQFNANDFDNDSQFQSAILASTGMPVFWPPIKDIATKSKQFKLLVDGGIRNTTPLGDVVHDDPDLIIIINCSYPKLKGDIKGMNKIIPILKRSLLDISMNEIFITDLKEFLILNDLVKQGNEKGVLLNKVDMELIDGTFKIIRDKNVWYKMYENIIIQPSEDMGDTLDFRQDIVQKRMTAGYEAAQKAFEMFLKDHPGYTFYKNAE